MIREEAVFRELDGYLRANMPGIEIEAKSQPSPSAFPAVTLGLKSAPARTSIYQEEIATVTLFASVWAEALYDSYGKKGVMSISDDLNALMSARHFARYNQGEPYFDASAQKWRKDSSFTKIM